MKKRKIKKTIVGYTANRTKRKPTMTLAQLVNTIYDTHLRHHATEYIGKQLWFQRDPPRYPKDGKIVLTLRLVGSEIAHDHIIIEVSQSELTVECQYVTHRLSLSDPECFIKASAHFKELLRELCERSKFWLDSLPQTSKKDSKSTVLQSS